MSETTVRYQPDTAPQKKVLPGSVPVPAGEEPVYDVEEACRFVVERTGYAPAQVEAALTAQELYLGALGILPRDYFASGVDLEAEVAQRPDLFPARHRAEGLSSWELEAEFVSQRTELPYRSVLEILLGESAYATSIGVLDQEAYQDHCTFVAERRQGLIDRFHLLGH